MNNWNQLLAMLDKTIGFPNRIDSTVKKVRQGYDEKKNEHVIYLEYRARVKPGTAGNENPQVLTLLRDSVSGRPVSTCAFPAIWPLLIGLRAAAGIRLDAVSSTPLTYICQRRTFARRLHASSVDNPPHPWIPKPSRSCSRPRDGSGSVVTNVSRDSA